MSDHPSTRLQIAVTPPGRYSDVSFRRWLESEARKQGYIDLKWSEDIDCWGQPMGRLTGKKEHVGWKSE